MGVGKGETQSGFNCLYFDYLIKDRNAKATVLLLAAWNPFHLINLIALLVIVIHYSATLFVWLSEGVTVNN